MVTRKPISWFLSDQGRRFSFAFMTSVGLAGTAIKFTPHTFLLDKYKDFVHYYNNGKPVQLPKEIQDCYHKCLDLLQVTDVHRKLIEPFSVFGYDLFHAGSCNSRFGAAIGIPVNFTYNTISDLENDGIQVNQKKVDWSSNTGQKLANALILPEKVKQFAICREIIMTQNYKVMFESVYPFTSVFFAYSMCQYLNKKLNLYAATPHIRGALYSIVGLFSLGTYFLFKDMTEVHYETEADKKLCELDPDFIECGIIFYDNLLKRNQALRELMGKEGERKYSKLGNENFFLRQPRIALIHRKQFFEEKYENMRNLNKMENNLLPE